MFKKIIALVVTLVFFAGCAGMGINPAELQGNHARGNWANKTFLMAWADYQRYAALPNLTDEAKELLRSKRTVLAEFVSPLYGPVVIFNKAVAGNEIIDDAVWNALLDKLILLETGWYTNGNAYSGNAQAVSQNLDPKVVFVKARPEQQTEENLIKLIQVEAVNAGIREDTGTKSQMLWEGLLIELIRTGVHALRAMLEQRGKTPEELVVAWEQSWAQIQALDPNSLVVIQ